MNTHNKRNKNRSLSRYGNDNRIQQTAMNATLTATLQHTTTNKVRPPAQGVYSNTFFMHAATALVGNVVQLRLRSGNVYEGVFRTFSPNFDVALELPLCVLSNKINADDENQIPKTIIFPYDTVVNIAAKDFDSHYATVGAFQTDAVISEKYNGSRFEEKELEPWDSGLNGGADIELDGLANGWSADEMFRKNENQYGVISTFDDSLSTYTMQIDKKDSLEFKEAELRAEKLAAEIENNPTCRDRLDLENGDEEAIFAAVERPSTGLDRQQKLEKKVEHNMEKECEDLEKECGRYRMGDSDTYESLVEHMPERYITKPIRNMNASLPSSSLSMNATATSLPGMQSHHDGNDMRGVNSNEMIKERDEYSMNANASQKATDVATVDQISNTQQLTNMGGMKVSSISTLNDGLVVSPQDNNGNNGNKYISGSMMKRKNTPQSGKIVRNTPSASNNTGSGGSSGTLAPASNNSISANKSNSANNYSIQSQPSYQNYPQLHGPIYRNTSHINISNTGNTAKGGSSNEANSSKQMALRNMRQYQGNQSNSALHYTDTQNQISKTHGPQAQGGGGSSSALQSGGSGGTSLVALNSQAQQSVCVQQTPQPQRQIRSRENHVQDLRQFGHDFQLAPQANLAQVIQHQQPAHSTQHQSQQQQQQSQQLHQAPPPAQMHMTISSNKGQQQTQQYHQTQQSVSPQQHHQAPQQQQQQQLIAPSQQTQIHIPTMHATQPIVVHQQQPQPQPLHSAQHHYVQIPQQYATASQMAHQQAAAVNIQSQQQQHQHTHLITNTLPHQQVTLPQQQSPSQPQISPVVIPAPALLEPPLQPQLQHLQISKNESSIASNTIVAQIPQQSQISTASVTITTQSNAEKSSTPPATGTTSGTNNGSAAATTTASVKKTHVLNPSAKPFTPRTPTTPNASRPHTPQTPVPQLTGVFSATATPATAPNQIFLMQSQQTPPAFQVPTHPQTGQQPRPRRNNYAMSTSQLHVSATAAAATGQPLLAGGPMQQFIYHQQAPPAAHFPTQAYGHMMRMYHEPTPQQLQFLAQTPPSTTSPGQPHQTFHATPQPSPAAGGPQSTFAPQSQPQPCQIMCPVVYPTSIMQSPYYQPAPQIHSQQSQQYQIVMQHPTQ